MNKNEFAENLVKEFSVKHPNYSASVKKPEEEPITDDVCAMFQKNRTVILVHMDVAFEDYCQHGIEVVLQKIDNSLTYCEKNGKRGEELVDTLDCYESIKDRLFIRAFNCETGRKKMEKNKCMDGRMGHGGRVCGIRGADSVCGDQLCEQCQHHAGCDTDGGGIPAGSRCGIQF